MAFGNRRHIPVPIKHQMVALSATHSSLGIAKILHASDRTVRRVNRLALLTGSVTTQHVPPGRRRILTTLDVDFLEGCIERTPDLYLSELRWELDNACDIVVSENTISRALRRRGFARKKVTRPALEQDEDLRDYFHITVAENFRPNQLVFVDEAAANRHTSSRSMAWSPIGTRARRHDYFVRGQRYSILPALSLDGVLHLDVQDRSYTAVSFNEFVEGLLDIMNPFPAPNSVVVMDNASIHKSVELRQLIEERGMRLLYLPPYSPDLNPIEEAFSAIKAWIRANRDYVRGELTGEITCDPYGMLWEAVFGTVTPRKAAGWFQGCGYLT